MLNKHLDNNERALVEKYFPSFQKTENLKSEIYDMVVQHGKELNQPDLRASKESVMASCFHLDNQKMAQWIEVTVQGLQTIFETQTSIDKSINSMQDELKKLSESLSLGSATYETARLEIEKSVLDQIAEKIFMHIESEKEDLKDLHKITNKHNRLLFTGLKTVMAVDLLAHRKNIEGVFASLKKLDGLTENQIESIDAAGSTIQREIQTTSFRKEVDSLLDQARQYLNFSNVEDMKAYLEAQRMTHDRLDDAEKQLNKKGLFALRKFSRMRKRLFGKEGVPELEEFQFSEQVDKLLKDAKSKISAYQRDLKFESNQTFVDPVDISLKTEILEELNNTLAPLKKKQADTFEYDQLFIRAKKVDKALGQKQNRNLITIALIASTVILGGALYLSYHFRKQKNQDNKNQVRPTILKISHLQAPAVPEIANMEEFSVSTSDGKTTFGVQRKARA